MSAGRNMVREADHPDVLKNSYLNQIIGFKLNIFSLTNNFVQFEKFWEEIKRCLPDLAKC